MVNVVPASPGAVAAKMAMLASSTDPKEVHELSIEDTEEPLSQPMMVRRRLELTLPVGVVRVPVVPAPELVEDVTIVGAATNYS